MERSIALFLFTLSHHDHEFVPVITKETQGPVVMGRLWIELGFAFSAFNPRYLNRLRLLTRQLTLPDELLLHSVGLDLRPPVFLPVRNDLCRFLVARGTQNEECAEEQLDERITGYSLHLVF